MDLRNSNGIELRNFYFTTVQKLFFDNFHQKWKIASCGAQFSSLHIDSKLPMITFYLYPRDHDNELLSEAIVEMQILESNWVKMVEKDIIKDNRLNIHIYTDTKIITGTRMIATVMLLSISLMKD